MFLFDGKNDYAEISDDEFFRRYDSSGNNIFVIDFDGVWVSSHEYKSKLFKEKGYDLPPEKTSRHLALEAGVPMDDYLPVSVAAGKDIVNSGTQEDGLLEYWQKIRVLPDTKIYIATSRFDDMMSSAIEYLKKYETFVDGIFNVNNKPKKEILKKLKADIFVDDIPSKIYELFDDKETCNKIDEELKNCHFIYFRNKSNSGSSQTTKGIVIDLHGGWEQLYNYIIANYFSRKN